MIGRLLLCSFDPHFDTHIFVWSGGTDLVSESGIEVSGYFNSEPVANAMQYFRSMVENKYMSAAPIEKLFESGRAAFKFDGAWEVILNTNKIQEKICAEIQYMQDCRLDFF